MNSKNTYTMSAFIKNCVFLIAIAMLIACEGETTYTTRIVNYTDEAISLLIYHQFDGSPEELFLMPGKSFTLFANTKNGGDETMPYCPGGLDSVSVFLFSGKYLDKDFLDPNEWNHQLISSRRGGLVDHYCDFEIYQKDLKF